MTTLDVIAAMLQSEPPLLTRKRTAEILSLTERSVDRMIARGELEALEFGTRAKRITKASLEARMRLAHAAALAA